MTIEEFESLVETAGLVLISSKYAPRFLVSLRVQKDFGVRYQAGRIDFASQQAFEDASRDDVMKAIASVKGQLERAAKTKQGVLR